MEGFHDDAQRRGTEKIAAPGRSPVIPFYWGYKPVTYDDWVADQQNYRKEVDVQKLGTKPIFPMMLINKMIKRK
jgi:hypothetical protein